MTLTKSVFPWSTSCVTCSVRMCHSWNISGLDTHSSLIQLAVLSKNRSFLKEKRRSLATSIAQASGISQLNIALSCIGSICANRNTSAFSGILVLGLLDNYQVVRAMSLLLSSSDIVSVAEILLESDVLTGGDLLSLIQIRTFILSKSDPSEALAYQVEMLELMLRHGFFDMAFQCLSRLKIPKEHSDRVNLLFIDASPGISDDSYLSFVLRLDPETISQKVPFFQKMVHRLTRISLDKKLKLPSKVFYEKILPALQLCVDDLSKPENRPLTYHIVHIFHIIEPSFIKRAIFYKILEASPGFAVEKIDAETGTSVLPSQLFIFQNLPYSFKCFFYYLSASQSNTTFLAAQLTNFLYAYKQNRLVMEAFHTSLSSHMVTTHNGESVSDPKFETIVRCLLERNAFDWNNVTRVMFMALKQMKIDRGKPIIDAFNRILSFAGICRHSQEEFPKRAQILMAPVTFLLYSAPARGRFLMANRRSTLRHFCESGFQMYFNISVEVLRQYLRSRENGGKDTCADDLLSLLSHLLLLLEGISTYERSHLRLGMNLTNRQLPTVTPSIGASKTGERLGIVDLTASDYTLGDLKSLIDSGVNLDLGWVKEAFIRTFNLPEERKSSTLRKAFREFTVYSIGWSDKHFARSKDIYAMQSETDENMQFISAEKRMQQDAYQRHSEEKYDQEECVTFFWENAFQRICCSFADSMATFYFFLPHIPLKTYTLMAVDLIDQILFLGDMEARNAVLFIRCTLEAFEKSNIPSVRTEYDSVMGKFGSKIIQFIEDSSLYLQSTVNILTLIRETIDYICLSAQCKNNIVTAITKKMDNSEDAKLFGVLKGVFENYYTKERDGNQREQTSNTSTKRYRENRHSHRDHDRSRDRYSDRYRDCDRY